MERTDDIDVNIERRKQFEKYVQEQDKIREENQAQKKQKQLNEQNPQQKMLAIQKTWRQKLTEVEKALADYKSKNIDYKGMMASYGDLKGFYLQTNYAMNTFDRQNYKETLEKLMNSMADAKKKQEPRKKFKFSRRDQDFGVAFKDKEEKETVHKEGYEKTIPGLQNINDSTILYAEDQLNKPFKVINCTNTTVELKGITDILFLKQLKNCTVKAGPTKSTVFVDRCQNCTFEIACHQLRIHNTKDTQFGIFTSSKAIIEDTTSVKFKQYSFKYDKWQDHMKNCDLQNKPNLWRDIQDFNWLKQQASPNFQLIDS